MVIDPKTFGGTYAGEILAKKLDALGSRKLTGKVSSFLHHTFAGFTQLSLIEDDNLFKEFVVLWRNNRTSKAKFRPELDSLIGSIIVAASREWLRSEAG